MTELTSKGHDLLEGEESASRTSSEASTQARATVPTTSKLVFVSHSHADKDLADAVVDMLCTALSLRVADFRCTSVDGAKLRDGDQADMVLRREIRAVPVFLSILTPRAVTSTYVVFELGARWGTEKFHIPLLAKGAGAEVLKEPLKATIGLQLSEESEVLQLVQDVASELQRTAEPPQSWYQKMCKVVEISRAGSAPVGPGSPPERGTQTGVAGQPVVQHEPHLLDRLSEAAKTLLIKASSSSDGFVGKHKSAMHGEIVSVHSKNQEFLGKVEDNRTRAKWVHAFNELIRAGCFEPTSHDGTYTITHVGYELADALKRLEI